MNLFEKSELGVKFRQRGPPSGMSAGEYVDYDMLAIHASRKEDPTYKALLKCTDRHTFVDVGANVGCYALSLAKHFDNVIAFEPHPWYADGCAINITENKLTNVDLRRQALSDNVEFFFFNMPMWATPSNEDKGSEFSYKIDAFRLDDLIGYVSAMKIDVEGYEYKVLLGATKLLAECKPNLVIEMHDNFYNWHNTQPVLDLLGSLDYRWEVIENIHNDIVISAWYEK